MKILFTTKEKDAIKMDLFEKGLCEKNRFYIPPNSIYLSGHSLGLLSKDAESSLARVVSEVKNLGVGGWMKAKTPWFSYAEKLSVLQAPLIGAKPEEVIVHGSTTINLYVLLSTFFNPKSKKKKILVEEPIFPSDKYAIESYLKLMGLDPKKNLKLVPSANGEIIEEQEIIKNMTDDVQLVILPSVVYQTGQLLDIALLTREAHKRGILIGFNCCHSVGIVAHQLSKDNVDFAFYCNYKYMNAGPGSVGGLYINQKHKNKRSGMAGWWGSKKEKQFDMLPDFDPAYLAGGFQISTPHIFSMAPLEGVLGQYKKLGIKKIREASLKRTEYLMYLVDKLLKDKQVVICTPREKSRRGGSVTIKHPYAASLNKTLKEKGFISDYREPNLIRITPNPLYVSYHDIYKTAHAIKNIFETGEYKNYKNKRDAVA